MAVREYQVVAALAGRRIDAENAKVARFPLRNVPDVKIALSKLFERKNVDLLICSAACGADLLALEVASEAGIRCRVVLPFDIASFRQTSVVDRPGDWAPAFDRIIPLVKSHGDLVVLEGNSSTELSYKRANERIIRETLAVSSPKRLAIVVWEGRPRVKGDATAEFRYLAIEAGIAECVVDTLAG